MTSDVLTAALAELGDPELTLARVHAQYSDRWLVQPAEGAAGDGPAPTPRLAPARGRLRDAADGPPVTGDWVALDASGTIAHVLPRRGAIVRRAAGEPARGQVLAAHVDLALVVEPLPDPNARRAERFVAVAAAGDVPAAVVLTKADREPGDAAGRAAAFARELGVLDGVAVSALDGDGLGVVRSLLTPGATAVLLGPSGAGKSTLVNALLGEERQATGAVRAHDDRGRHTTVTRELVPLPGGALLLDTPGIREIGVWDDGTTGAFADIDALAADCRFADCAHDGEPGCAVAAGVTAERLAAWHKLRREQAWIDDRRAASRQREERERFYGRVQREARRVKGDDD